MVVELLFWSYITAKCFKTYLNEHKTKSATTMKKKHPQDDWKAGCEAGFPNFGRKKSLFCVHTKLWFNKQIQCLLFHSLARTQRHVRKNASIHSKIEIMSELSESFARLIHMTSILKLFIEKLFVFTLSLPRIYLETEFYLWRGFNKNYQKALAPRRQVHVF